MVLDPRWAIEQRQQRSASWIEKPLRTRAVLDDDEEEEDKEYVCTGCTRDVMKSRPNSVETSSGVSSVDDVCLL